MEEELTYFDANGTPTITSLSRELFSTKNMILKSWMKLPSFRVSNRGSCVFNTGLSLFLSFRLNGADPDRKMKYQDMKSSTFTISTHNIGRVRPFINRTKKWVEYPLKDQIFELDPVDNTLRLKSEFIDSFITLVDDRKSNGMQAIRAAPQTCDTKDGHIVPGVEYFINQEQYAAVIPGQDVITLSAILNDFSFQQEEYLLLTMLTHKEIMLVAKNDFGDFTEKENPFDPASHPVIY